MLLVTLGVAQYCCYIIYFQCCFHKLLRLSGISSRKLDAQHIFINCHDSLGFCYIRIIRHFWYQYHYYQLFTQIQCNYVFYLNFSLLCLFLGLSVRPVLDQVGNPYTKTYGPAYTVAIYRVSIMRAFKQMRTKESLLQCHPALIPQNLGPLPSWLPVNTSLQRRDRR